MKNRMLTASICTALICLSIHVAAQQQVPSTKAPVTVASSTSGTTAQNASAPSLLQFKSKSQMVVVPVVVTRNGAPVTDLKKEQFKIFENGKEQKISVFEEVKSDPTPIAVSRTRDREQKVFSNMQVDQASPKRLVIVVLDLINTRFEDRAYARQQLIKFLSETVDRNALISLVALGRHRVKVIHDFTSNPDTLIAALNRVSKKGESGSDLNSDLGAAESEVFESEVNSITGFLENGEFSGGRPFGGSGGGGGVYRWLTIRQTLDGMNLIAQTYAGVPGRKALIWATGGFPFSIDGSTMLLNPGNKVRDPSTETLADILDYYEHTWDLMNNANFAIYPVDLRGLVVNNITAAESVAPRNLNNELQRRSLIHNDTIATFDTFAEMTGGQAFYNTNDLAHSFKKATVDSASYYMLAYYLQDPQANGKKEHKKDWRKLKVKVDAPSVNIRTRSGFFANADQTQTYKNEIALAISSPLEFTALPVTVRWLDTPPSTLQPAAGTTGTTPAQKKISFELYVPANIIAIDTNDSNNMSVDIVASARTGTGTEVNGIAQTIAGHLQPDTIEKMRTSGFLFKSDIALPPGRYSVRFVVHDNIGQRTGSVAAPLLVKN